MSLALFFLTDFSYPAEKLLDPAKLSEVLKSPTSKKTIIFNIGPSPMITEAILIGETKNLRIKPD